MLLHGTSRIEIFEALGQVYVAFTTDTYAHIINDMQQDTTNLLHEMFPRGVVPGNRSNSKYNVGKFTIIRFKPA